MYDLTYCRTHGTVTVYTHVKHIQPALLSKNKQAGMNVQKKIV